MKTDRRISAIEHFNTDFGWINESSESDNRVDEHVTVFSQ